MEGTRGRRDPRPEDTSDKARERNRANGGVVVQPEAERPFGEHVHGILPSKAN
jgi:hypothetical protein